MQRDWCPSAALVGQEAGRHLIAAADQGEGGRWACWVMARSIGLTLRWSPRAVMSKGDVGGGVGRTGHPLRSLMGAPTGRPGGDRAGGPWLGAGWFDAAGGWWWRPGCLGACRCSAEAGAQLMDLELPTPTRARPIMSR